MLSTTTRYLWALLLLAAVAAVPSVQAQDAVPTTVTVRAVAQDAKLMHDAVGGALITIREQPTGRVLAEGVQQGSSGSTDRIIREAQRRGGVVYDTEGAAGFVATIPLQKPTVVEISAQGPLNFPQAMQRATKTMLLMPGHDITGDGIVLTLHGFIVEILEPSGLGRLTPGDSVDVRASVKMMCGCPTEPGGLWDAEQIGIEAQIMHEDQVVRSVPLRYAGEPSTYEGTLTVPEEGQYEVQVMAMDAGRVNFGRDWQQLVVEE